MGVDATLVFRCKNEFSSLELDSLCYDLSDAFGDEIINCEIPEDDIIIKPISQTDSATINLPKYISKTGFWYDVALSGSYYGQGYERGPINVYTSIAEWIETRIEQSEIWYGDDGTSGNPLCLFNSTERKRIFSYFCKVGHKPYFESFQIHAEILKENLPICCNHRMTWIGYASHYATII